MMKQLLWIVVVAFALEHLEKEYFQLIQTCCCCFEFGVQKNLIDEILH